VDARSESESSGSIRCDGSARLGARFWHRKKRKPANQPASQPASQGGGSPKKRVRPVAGRTRARDGCRKGKRGEGGRGNGNLE
jgi:hypothetical protein